MNRLFAVCLTIIFSHVGIAYSQNTITPQPRNNAISSSKQQTPLRQLVANDQGRFTTRVKSKDGDVRKTLGAKPSDVADVIVEFTDTPQFIQQKAQKKMGQLNMLSRAAAKGPTPAARFSQFASDLARMQRPTPGQSIQGQRTKALNTQTLSAQAQPAPPAFKHQYQKVFSGVSMEVKRDLLSSIQDLPYVKKVHLNKKVHAFLNESVPLINADKVHTTLGAKGDGMVVAVIDTGIDYTHPALGGGFGPGFKVIGGYDFVNQDNDPMDDVSHGTHVAGIIAANGGGLTGVAPHASLIAYKVLDEFGGHESDIIAAIERSVDPNGDGDPSDRVDVVNMSLGSDIGDPDDAGSQAVDNAVALGVVFSISAGNSGDAGDNTGRFFSIGSPGSARSAITVGASSKTDQMALLSSKGPNLKILSIKPEVSAPGVDIRSSVLNGGYEAFDGTSMAAPHVTGVIALLRELHPSWTPGQIKSALMTTAIDLGEEEMIQGAGRIDALAAAEANVFALPAHLSFGLDDLTQAIWTPSKTIQIVNESGQAQDYVVSEGALPQGVTMNAVPNRFTLADGATQALVVTFTVNNERVPSPTEGSLAYSGHLLVASATNTLKLPWAFVKTPRVTFKFDMPHIFLSGPDDAHVLARFSIFNENIAKNILDYFGGADSSIEMIDPKTFSFFMPPGTYDVMANFDESDQNFTTVASRFVLKERLEVNGFHEFQINSTDAVHAINVAGVDEQGYMLSTLPGNSHRKNLIIAIPESYPDYYIDYDIIGNNIINAPLDVPILLSNMSERYRVFVSELHSDLGGTDNVHMVNYAPIAGIRGDFTPTNDPSDFVSQQITVKFPPNTLHRNLIFPNLIITSTGYEYSFATVEKRPIDSDNWVGKLFISPSGEDIFQRLGTQVYAESTDQLFERPWAISKPFNVIENNSIGSFVSVNPSPVDFISPNGGNMSFGGGLVYPTVFSINNGAVINMESVLYGAMNEEMKFINFNNANLALYDDQNNLVISDSYPGLSLDVEPGAYRFEVNYQGYYVNGIQGQATLTGNFDSRKEDANFPRISSLKLLNAQGNSIDTLVEDEAARLVFSTADYQLDETEVWQYQSMAPDSAHLYVRESGTGDTWQEMDITQILEDTKEQGELFAIGHVYEADFSELTEEDDFFNDGGKVDKGDLAVDIKILIEDNSSNTTEWVLEPAFVLIDD